MRRRSHPLRRLLFIDSSEEHATHSGRDWVPSFLSDPFIVNLTECSQPICPKHLSIGRVPPWTGPLSQSRHQALYHFISKDSFANVKL